MQKRTASVNFVLAMFQKQRVMASDCGSCWAHLLDILLLTQFHKTLPRSIASVENLLQQVEHQIGWAIFACSYDDLVTDPIKAVGKWMRIAPNHVGTGFDIRFDPCTGPGGSQVLGVA